MSANPKVSVLIPTYNYANFLDETIQSVLDQTLADFELVIVDNCSTDNTAEVVRKYLSDSRVSFHRNEKNVGLVGNWNRCLDLARGEYVKILCADDKLHPHMLQRFADTLDAYPQVSIASSYNQNFGSENDVRITPFKGLIKGAEMREHLLKVGARNWLYNPSAVMWRRSGAEAIGKFDASIIKATDLEYYLRLLTIGDCYIIPEVLSYTRTHANTQTASLRRKKYEYVFEKYLFIASVRKNSRTQHTSDGPSINRLAKQYASNCAALMYKVIPQIYKKENRAIFKRALRIGINEHVLLDPVKRLIRGEVDVKNAAK